LSAEVADAAFKAMRKPKDIFLIDMDNHGKAVVVTEEQIIRL
jgi:predicted nucleic acid-binding protein